jgi:hypothetical protein
VVVQTADLRNGDHLRAASWVHWAKAGTVLPPKTDAFGFGDRKAAREDTEVSRHLNGGDQPQIRSSATHLFHRVHFDAKPLSGSF